jgi:hypothetical protein
LDEYRVTGDWSLFNVRCDQRSAREQEIIHWCEQLDGSNGLFFAKVWSVSGMNMYIEDPDQAFLFKLRWK